MRPKHLAPSPELLRRERVSFSDSDRKEVRCRLEGHLQTGKICGARYFEARVQDVALPRHREVLHDRRDRAKAFHEREAKANKSPLVLEPLLNGLRVRAREQEGRPPAGREEKELAPVPPGSVVVCRASRIGVGQGVENEIVQLTNFFCALVLGQKVGEVQVKEGRRRQARKTTTFDASLGGRVVKIVEVVATERVGHVVVLAREPLLVGGPKIFSVELDSLFNETSCCA